jgi:hypothetical protein
MRGTGNTLRIHYSVRDENSKEIIDQEKLYVRKTSQYRELLKEIPQRIREIFNGGKP